jgi:hypothetical protein
MIGLGDAIHRDGNGETNNGVQGDGIDSILLKVMKIMGKDE